LQAVVRRKRRYIVGDSAVSPDMKTLIEANIMVYSERAAAGVPLFAAG
jgi:hypothetical protein